MFCPLCKSEFRDGFMQCSDCHIFLVRTQEEANDRAVTRVWRGGDKHELKAVLTALRQTGIPLVFRQHRNAVSALGQAALSLFLLEATQGLSNEFEVTVLESDAPLAQSVIQRALADPELDAD
jgi:hypothetical protein